MKNQNKLIEDLEFEEVHQISLTTVLVDYLSRASEIQKKLDKSISRSEHIRNKIKKNVRKKNSK